MALPQVGQVFGRYRIDDLIGRGGMGVVLGATDTGLGRRVALKVVAADLGGADEFRTRFEREAATLARLASPHVIAIYDYGTQDDCPYIATQYVAGGDLGAYLHDRGPMSPGEALRVCSQVADALDDAHRAGIVHRDVKPTNVLVRDRESDETYVYLCDFGIARDGTDGLTAPGAVAGTWSYLSPENGRGAPASASSDLYAVGCLLWATLTGFPPYRGTDVAIALAHQRDPIPQLPGDSALVRAVNAILTRAMAKEAVDRYPDAGSLRDALLAAAALPGADGPAIPVAQDDPTVWPHTGVRAATPASTPTPQAPSGAPPPRPPSYPPSYPPAPAYSPQHRPPTPTPTPVAPPRRGRGRVVAAVVGVLVLVGGGVTAVLLTGGDDDPDPGPTAGPTSAGDPTSGATTGSDPSSPPTTEVPDGPITGDLDGDGIGDLSMDYDPAEGDGLLTTTWTSDGTTFVDPQTSDLGPRSGRLTWRVRGHLDDDETADVVTFSRSGEKAPDVTISGTLSGGGSVGGELAGAVSDNDALADVDGDGVDELLNLEVKGDRKIVMTTRTFDGTTFGAARKSLTFTDDINRFAIWPGDYDGDGRVDIATLVLTGKFDVSTGYSGTVEIRTNDGEGGFAEPVSAPFNSGQSSLSLHSGDIDADGDDELVIADRDTRIIVLNAFDLDDDTITPRPNIGGIRYVNTAPVDLAVVDADGDGADDVVSVGLLRPGGTARVLVGLSNGSTFTSRRWLAWDQRFAARTNNDEDRFEVLEDTRW